MYSLNDITREYITDLNQWLSQRNKDPVRFIFEQQLGSVSDVLFKSQYGSLKVALNQLTINSMHAISGIICWPSDILENWKPDVPGKLIYRTKESEDMSMLELEDNGCGINPDTTMEKVLDVPSNLSPKEAVNLVFADGVSTKGGVDKGRGMGMARRYVEGLGGRIYIVGTSYESYGELKTVGEHYGLNSGTIVRMEFPIKRE